MNSLSRQDEQKKAAADAALAELVVDTVVGVGTGSTVNFFIDALAARKAEFLGAVSSSMVSTKRLLHHGIKVMSLNEVIAQGLSLPVYVDGADEINSRLQMIKGGGGALTQEKIIASVAQRFICVADSSKRVEVLGKYPLPVEVISGASEVIGRRFSELGATAKLRSSFVSDNGHPILDVSGLSIDNAVALEDQINAWPGVVTVGLFARRPADLALIATAEGMQRLVR
jgi:ribose 5-phosphate isomerase A